MLQTVFCERVPQGSDLENKFRHLHKLALQVEVVRTFATQQYAALSESATPAPGVARTIALCQNSF